MMLAQSSEQENELHARKERILIVDDSELNRALLTEMLEDDYEILESGQRAGVHGHPERGQR